MGKVLYIKASPKQNGTSNTYRIADAFIIAYQHHHPQDEITILDLYSENISYLTEEDIAMHAQFAAANARSHPALKYAYQFLEADKLVFAEPLWNLGIPAILKSYFDYICIAGLTFQYTPNGAIGLCEGKKAVNITTRGGNYSTGFLASVEMGDRYIKTVLNFLGITQYDMILAEGLDVVGNDSEAILSMAMGEAGILAEAF